MKSMKFHTLFLISCCLLPSITHSTNWLTTLWNALFNTSSPQPVIHTQQSHTQKLTEQQAIAYINEIIASLEHALTPHTQVGELTPIKQKLLNILHSSSHLIEWTAQGKKYKKDLLDQYISSALIEYVETTSYNYAYQYTCNSTVARKIANSMRNNFMAVIQRTSLLDAEQLAPYFGEKLRKKIRTATYYYEVPHQLDYNHEAPEQYTTPSHPTPSEKPNQYDIDVYPSDECVICSEDLTHYNRIFLYPCGHDMCKTCAHQYYFIRNNTLCPYCRTTINKEKLKQDL